MGYDSRGNLYSSIDHLWHKVKEQGSFSWYNKTLDYWRSQPADVSGVLAGHQHLSSTDLEDSKKFVQKIKNHFERTQRDLFFNRALDCGAGVGRVTEGCLSKFFNKIDLVEPAAHFIEEAERRLSTLDNVADFYKSSLQTFVPDIKMYDCIWIQWAALHLTDEDLIHFLIRAKNGLTDYDSTKFAAYFVPAQCQGFICIKENVTKDPNDEFYLDDEDNGLTRSESHYAKLFEDAGLHVEVRMEQSKFPEIYKVVTSTYFWLQLFRNIFQS